MGDECTHRAVKILGLHHIAFAHGSGTETVDALAALLDLEPDHVEDGDGFIERMLTLEDGVHIQTLEASGPGVVDDFVGRRGSALHHIALEVDDVAGAVRELKRRGANLVDQEPRSGGMGTRIAFVHPRSFGGLLVELVEETGED